VYLDDDEVGRPFPRAVVLVFLEDGAAVVEDLEQDSVTGVLLPHGLRPRGHAGGENVEETETRNKARGVGRMGKYCKG